MAWQTVAEGASITELKQLVSDMELPKGSKVRVVMNTPVPWLFDVAGAELAFRPFIPDGLDLIDVYGEDDKGIVDMEADPAWLIAVLAFIKAHWLAIIIAGFVLTVIVSFIRVMVEVATASSVFPAIYIIIAAVIVVGILLSRRKANPRRMLKRQRKKIGLLSN